MKGEEKIRSTSPPAGKIARRTEEWRENVSICGTKSSTFSPVHLSCFILRGPSPLPLISFCAPWPCCGAAGLVMVDMIGFLDKGGCLECLTI